MLANFDKVRRSLESSGQHQQCLLSAPGLLDILMQANREYLQQSSVSDEIANFFHEELLRNSGPIEPLLEQVPIVCMYNLDKERLEEALRKKLILRILD